jgi:two-component system sensor histidine kinase PhoQ
VRSFSIRRRLLLISALLVFGFIGAAAWSLNAAFRDATRTALVERLQAHIYTLLASAKEDPKGRLRMPETLPDPLFNRPDSGLYAMIEGEQGGYHWRSASLLGRALPAPAPLATGRTRQRYAAGLLILDQAIAWEDIDGQAIPYTISVAADTRNLVRQQDRFRKTLWIGLGALSGLLLVVQLLTVRWGLGPLAGIIDNVRRIEQGEIGSLPDSGAVELRPLTRALNALIHQAHARQERVRHSLADLAHSLKTPLSVLRGLSETLDDRQAGALIDEQVTRIDEIVSYQRQRAVVSGNSGLQAPQAVRPVVERLGRGLARLPRHSHIRLEIDLAPGFTLRIEPGDLLELLGNLLENAFRHAVHTVRVSSPEPTRPRLVIEDDGKGIPPALRDDLLKRGVRADQRHPGQGIGLAVVSEILTQYGASLRIGESPLGGARFEIDLASETPC